MPPENVTKSYGVLMFSWGKRKGALGTNGLIFVVKTFYVSDSLMLTDMSNILDLRNIFFFH